MFDTLKETIIRIKRYPTEGEKNLIKDSYPEYTKNSKN
jgi:hypothetical protein